MLLPAHQALMTGALQKHKAGAEAAGQLSEQYYRSCPAALLLSLIKSFPFISYGGKQVLYKPEKLSIEPTGQR